MKKVLKLAVFTLLLSFAPVSGVFANSYSGETVAPESDGKTYNVTTGSAGTVTLTDLGSGDGTLAISFNKGVDGSIVVEESTQRPSDATSDAPGTVNLYFDVTLNGLTNDDITSAVWTFTVNKDFLTQNGVTESNVFLHHFNGSEWERLTTTEVSSTDTAVTFEAQVDSFSPFAVTAVEGLSNTGSPYMLGAVLAVSTLAVVGGSFFLSRKGSTTV